MIARVRRDWTAGSSPCLAAGIVVLGWLASTAQAASDASGSLTAGATRLWVSTTNGVRLEGPDGQAPFTFANSHPTSLQLT